MFFQTGLCAHGSAWPMLWILYSNWLCFLSTRRFFSCSFGGKESIMMILYFILLSIFLSYISSLTAFLHIWQPSESWSPPNDNCIKYDCQKVNGDFIVSRNQTTCPEYDPDNCIPVSIVKNSNRKHCISVSFQLFKDSFWLSFD